MQAISLNSASSSISYTIGGLVRSFRIDLLSLTINNYSVMQYSFVTHTGHNVVKNNFSINLVKIRIKTEYGHFT